MFCVVVLVVVVVVVVVVVAGVWVQVIFTCSVFFVFWSLTFSPILDRCNWVLWFAPLFLKEKLVCSPVS